MRKLTSAFMLFALLPGIALCDFSANGPGFPIADNSTATSVIEGSGDGQVEDMIIFLNGITHTWVGDLTIQVEHEGEAVRICVRPGVPTDTQFGHDVDLDGDYTFDDDDVKFLDFTVACMAADETFGGDGSLNPGVYIPLDNLSNFFGTQANGNWTLSIQDSVAGDSGALTSWGLLVFTAPCPFKLGDCNEDFELNLLDVSAFVDKIVSGQFACQADFNFDGAVTLLDISGFVSVLTGG